MLTIGLTGPTGAGKGTVAALFLRYGIPSVDTDAVYHRLLIPPSPCVDDLTARFGTGILAPDGSVDRKTLAALVFADGHEQDLDDLNHISHRHIWTATREACARFDDQGCPAVLIDAPLLFESGFDRACDRILCVLAHESLRFERIMARDHLSPDAARARLHAQKDDAFFRARAHAVIENNGDPEAMDRAIRAILCEWGIPT